MGNTRLEHMDVAKGIGIIAIIIGHTSNLFEKYMFPFHVPLFFLISGYFLSFKKPLEEYVMNKISQLLVPYCFTSLIVVAERTILSAMRGKYWESELLRSMLSAIYGSGSSENKTLFEIEPIGAIWFLLSLFIALILVRGIIICKYYVPLLITLVTISIITSYYLWLPWSVQAGITAAVYVYIGFFIKDKIKFNNPWIALAGFIIYIIEVITGIRVSVASNRYDAHGLAFIGAVIIVYSIIYLSIFLCRVEGVKNVFSFMGRNTLPILCFHLIEITVFPWGHFPLALELILLIVFPIICILLLGRTTVYRYIFSQSVS